MSARLLRRHARKHRTVIDKGETIYVGKVDSLKLYPGRERIGLRGDLRYGLTQTRCTISWLHPSGEEQSKSIDIVRTSPDDKLDVVLTDMQEGPYEFTVITYDGLGNKSIPVRPTAMYTAICMSSRW